MPDYGWTLTVYGRQVDPNQCSLLCDVPMQMTSETLQSMWLLLRECNICAGHSDPDFVRMAEARKGKLLSGPYLGKFDWGGGCVPCGRRPQRGEVCGRGMCPLLHKVRKLKYTSIL